MHSLLFVSQVVHHRPEIFKGQLDFGTLGVGEARSMTFTLRNDNPLPVLLREYGCNLKRCALRLLGVERGNGTMLRGNVNSSGGVNVSAAAAAGGGGSGEGDGGKKEGGGDDDDQQTSAAVDVDADTDDDEDSNSDAQPVSLLSQLIIINNILPK